MADEDRQPPQAYDTGAPAGVGASGSNQVSPGTIQEILDTGDSSLIDQAFDQMTVEDMIAYVDQLPSPPPFRTSSPAGVGSPGSQSFRSIHTTPPSSPDTPLSRGSAGLSSGARTPLSQGSARLSSGARTPATPPSVPRAAGARTAAGAGGKKSCIKSSRATLNVRGPNAWRFSSVLFWTMDPLCRRKRAALSVFLARYCFCHR